MNSWDTKKCFKYFLFTILLLKNLFQILPFYSTFIEKPEIKKLSNIKLLHELPFYDELSIVKNSSAFSGHAKSYKVEIVDSKDPLVQLEASKSSIKVSIV